MTVKRHTNDKPWVTDQFRYLIRCRQHMRGQQPDRAISSVPEPSPEDVEDTAAQVLRQEAGGMRNDDTRTWWRSVKFITGQTVNTTQPMTGLANQLHNGDVPALADSANCFQGVAADLNPIEQYVVTA